MFTKKKKEEEDKTPILREASFYRDTTKNNIEKGLFFPRFIEDVEKASKDGKLFIEGPTSYYKLNFEQIKYIEDKGFKVKIFRLSTSKNPEYIYITWGNTEYPPSTYQTKS